jgi:hypothetical protein
VFVVLVVHRLHQGSIGVGGVRKPDLMMGKPSLQDQ